MPDAPTRSTDNPRWRDPWTPETRGEATAYLLQVARELDENNGDSVERLIAAAGLYQALVAGVGYD